MRGTKDFRPMDMKAYLIDDRFWEKQNGSCTDEDDPIPVESAE